LLFVGAMHRHPNVDAMRYFCRDVLPLVHRDLPHVRLTIVGNQPPPDLARLTEDPRIRVTGFVPALEPYFARATVFVSPMRIGGGILLKNVDAMAAGCPVVTTSIGNEGVGATPGRHLVTADDTDAFARAVVQLLRDEGERRRLAEQGRQFVGARFSLDATVNGLEDAYREAGG
jgi:glycosyltransferase involved in cell wall biosynthesis